MSAVPHQAAFQLPVGGEATSTPEARGLARDEVRLLVARPGEVTHVRAHDLVDHLAPGDLVVVNTSATLPAAVDLVRNGAPTTVHVSTQLDDDAWVVEVRRPTGDGHATDVAPGEVLRLPGGQRLRLVGPHPASQSRLWRAVPVPARGTVDYLARHGRPVRYRYLTQDVPLEALQNVWATRPGSAEMPSAGRPLTERLLVRLMAKGIPVAPIMLHCGVSSLEAHEPPQPEPYVVPEVTARLVNGTRAAGRRVVAVGTTVVRALESAADPEGRVAPTDGWTDLVLSTRRRAGVVDGLMTGLHEPEASHLDLLRAVAGERLVDDAYAAVTAGDPAYLWHELGDSMLLLPEPSRRLAESLTGLAGQE